MTRLRNSLTRFRAWWATLWPGDRRRATYWAERYFHMARRLSRYELALEEIQEQMASYEIELSALGRRADEHDDDLDQIEVGWDAMTGRIELLEQLEDERQVEEDGTMRFGFIPAHLDDVAAANGAVLDQLAIEEERAA